MQYLLTGEEYEALCRRASDAEFMLMEKARALDVLYDVVTEVCSVHDRTKINLLVGEAIHNEQLKRTK